MTVEELKVCLKPFCSLYGVPAYIVECGDLRLRLYDYPIGWRVRADRLGRGPLLEGATVGGRYFTEQQALEVAAQLLSEAGY